jgi:hypothetical protein
MAAEVHALGPDRARRRPSPDAWCALEIVGHVIEAERRGFAGRSALLLDQDEPRLATWDPGAVAAARRDRDRDAAALASELLTLREASVRRLEGLTAADLARGGEHPDVGRLTVAELLHEWVHHDRAHLDQLLALTRALVWPHMGNARRFSG